MKTYTKKLTSVFLMLVFTASAFIVLAVSVVLMTVESLISALLPQTTTSKKGTGKEEAVTQGVKAPSREAQMCSRP